MKRKYTKNDVLKYLYGEMDPAEQNVFLDALCTDDELFETFEALKNALSDEEILELTYITCTYMMHAVMSRALRLEYDDVDERVVEIGPGGGLNSDVMSMVDRAEDS